MPRSLPTRSVIRGTLASLLLVVVYLSVSSSSAGFADIDTTGWFSLQAFRGSKKVDVVESSRVPPPALARVGSQTPSVTTRVGPRRFGSFYHGMGCNTVKLLDALENAQIREDGTSLSPLDPRPTKFDLSNFTISFGLPNCPPLHIFTTAEACDLISSFGGVLIQGDSLMRHFKDALFMLLSHSLEISRSVHANCTGESLFETTDCRTDSFATTLEAHTRCSEQSFVNYDQIWQYGSQAGRKRAVEEGTKAPEKTRLVSRAPLVKVNNQNEYFKLRASLPPRRRKYSGIFLHATGLHYKFLSERVKLVHIDPFLANVDSLPDPTSIKLWLGYTAPGVNKPVEWLEKQGASSVLRFNAEIKTILDETSPGKTVSEGAWRQMDFYGISDRAYSLDGSHYGMQVNMEKVMLWLNLLDIVWGEISEAGGLVLDEDSEDRDV